MTDSIHETSLERDYNRAQAQFARHQQIGQGIAESPPAETAVVSAKRAVELEAPVSRNDLNQRYVSR